jgi:DNA end-binding protein Ku
MAARALGSATIAFGLVSIPVKLYSAAESAATVRFNQIDRRDGARIKQQLISANSGEVVPKEEIVKGYEFAKGQYVLFEDDELKALNPPATNTIEITEFVPLDRVDPIYFEKSYYLGPDKGGPKPYRLLAQAMKETGRAALARYAARGKDYLVLLRPFENGLIMQQLRYADEIRSFEEVPVGDADVKPAELQLALQLIDQIATDTFHPEEYHDEVREKVQALIERKGEGEEIVAAPEEQPKAQIIDLMEALKKSLGEPGGEGEAKERKPAKRAPRKAAAGGRAAAEEG